MATDVNDAPSLGVACMDIYTGTICTGGVVLTGVIVLTGNIRGRTKVNISRQWQQAY
jgi:hypothetical protein